MGELLARSLDMDRYKRSPDSMGVLFVLPTLNPYGGVISVVNMLNIMIDRGHAVTLASLSRVTVDRVYPKCEPILVSGLSDATLVPAKVDVAVATSWQTVPLVNEVARHNGAMPVYFVQGFDPDIYEDERRAAALSTYDLIEHKVVKTRYLQSRLLSEGGWRSELIRPGMNLDLFYPRQSFDSRSDDVVLAMARPGAPADHRGFDVLNQVFAELNRRHPSLKLRVFGTAKADGFDCPVEALGILSPEDLPKVYSEASVYVDTSLVHGFGRTGVEAMACGTPTVLSMSGGISDYARHMDNSLLVAAGDVGETVDAIETLLEDRALALALSKKGLETVSGFNDHDAASDLLGVFRKWLSLPEPTWTQSSLVDR